MFTPGFAFTYACCSAGVRAEKAELNEVETGDMAVGIPVEGAPWYPFTGREEGPRAWALATETPGKEKPGWGEGGAPRVMPEALMPAGSEGIVPERPIGFI